MPGPVEDFISVQTKSRINFGLEPAFNAFQSLLLLSKADQLSGFGDWVTTTLNTLTPEERHNQEMVFIGLHYATMPTKSWPSFPAYIDHLARMNPIDLQDKLLDAYACVPACAEDANSESVRDIPTFDKDSVLASVDNYLNFLLDRFGETHVDNALESQAYELVIEPQVMQDLIVNHLRNMWNRYLSPEWERVKPMLEESLQAFQQVDLSQMSNLEAVQYITGKDLSQEPHCNKIEEAEQFIFIPNAHLGPYMGSFNFDEAMAITFSARLPEGVKSYAPDLSRNEILIRLNALADDNRLRVLKFISDYGEQRSQDIMEALEFSQSASSRHLKQLSATGYIIERRCNGAKCYELNPQRIEDTLKAISVFLLGT